MIPALRYRDAPAAIEFLCRAFGFEKHLVVPGEANVIEHAQLVFGNGMIMLGHGTRRRLRASRPTAARPRRRLAGHYVVVADADEHHARAVAAGAKIVEELEDKDYGGRGYGCLDPEGNVWSFGTYDPWAD